MSEWCDRPEQAVAGIPDGATVLVSGFGLAGQPESLLVALLEQGARNLTVVCNNSGTGESGLARLIDAGRVSRLLASYPRGPQSQAFDRAFAEGRLAYECVPQGTLAERLRAAGAGLGGFLTPTGYGTRLAEGKETRVIEGRGYVWETPLRGDYALVSAHRADDRGNLVYRKSARNFGPVMCTAATTTIVTVSERVPTGVLDPEHIVTPSIFVNRLVEVPTLERTT